MDTRSAEKVATQAGLVTMPLGIALLADPARFGRLLDGKSHDASMRLIGTLDVALAPGLIAGRHRDRWLIARAGLNLLIAGYCAGLARHGGASGSSGARLTAASMVVATIFDGRAIAALRRSDTGH
jgi:hypothetical protein